MLLPGLTAGDIMPNRLAPFFIAMLLSTALQTPLHAEQQGIDKQRAVEIADRVYSGRVLAVKRKGKVYRVKKLNDRGEVRTIVIDADNGKVLGE